MVLRGALYSKDSIRTEIFSILGAQDNAGATKQTYLAETPYRIRKLTPKECWRLMGFTDEDFYKAEEVNSNTQLYKQAGNSIVVKVLEAIFKQML
ncbi:MAG: DNA cytosine methyltransferase [Acutalibacteraceae bacterium]